MDGLTKIIRSYSYRDNISDYRHKDYFCCQAMKCKIEDAEEVSDKLHEFCRNQVIKAVKKDFGTFK